MTTPRDPGEPSTREQLHTVGDDVSRLVHDELLLAREELAQTARRAGKGAGLLGAAAALGVLATGTSAALVLRLLDRMLPPATAAAAATALYGAGATIAARAGLAELRRARPLTPQRTMANLREDIETVTGAATRR